jgi:heterodisulfide reductase subunit A-like polyferredoxin
MFSTVAHLLSPYLIHYNNVRVVVLHRLHKDVSLLVTPGDHQTPGIADAGVALISITCSSSIAAAAAAAKAAYQAALRALEAA